MMHGKRVAVVMPAYNAAETLEATVAAIPPGVVDDLILVDDASRDETAAVARRLGLHTVVHPQNRGYGGNQKTCYAEALGRGAEVVVMLHPDLQYDPRLIPALASLVALGRYDVVLGSRFLGRGPLVGGMPPHKYVANRLLTRLQNRALGRRLSEYHTGYRAYSRAALERVSWQENAEGFLFDNQFLVQAIALDLEIGEVACPAHYPPEASSIRFLPAAEYAVGVVGTTLSLWLHQTGLRRSTLFVDAAQDRAGSSGGGGGGHAGG